MLLRVDKYGSVVDCKRRDDLRASLESVTRLWCNHLLLLVHVSTIHQIILHQLLLLLAFIPGVQVFFPRVLH